MYSVYFHHDPEVVVCLLVLVEVCSQETDNVGVLRVILEDIHLCLYVLLLVKDCLHYLDREGREKEKEGGSRDEVKLGGGDMWRIDHEGGEMWRIDYEGVKCDYEGWRIDYEGEGISSEIVREGREGRKGSMRGEGDRGE